MLSRQFHFLRVTDAARRQALCDRYNIDAANVAAMFVAAGGRELMVALDDGRHYLWLVRHGRVAAVAPFVADGWNRPLRQANDVLRESYSVETVLQLGGGDGEQAGYDKACRLAAIHNTTAAIAKALAAAEYSRAVLEPGADNLARCYLILGHDQDGMAPPAPMEIGNKLKALRAELNKTSADCRGRLEVTADGVVVGYTGENEVAFVYGVDPDRIMAEPAPPLAPFPTF